jgi:DNA invertase Pin-like site-specific DNA recombinase
VVVWRLDRLAGSLAHVTTAIWHLEEKRVGFRRLTEQIDTTVPGGHLIFHVFGAIAGFERMLDVERTQSGLVAPRARGRHGGRPRLSVMHEPKKLAQARELYAERRIMVGEICRLLGVSRSTFYIYVPERTARTVTNANA